MSVITDVSDRIGLFRTKLAIGMSSIVEACEVYVSVLDETPEGIELFQEAFEGEIPPSMWKHFEAIGRKWVHPQIVFGNINHRNLIKTLSYTDQGRALTGRVEYLTRNGDTLLIDVSTASKEVVNQVVGNGRIRTLSEQRLYIESNKTPTQNIEAAPPPYVIKKHRLYVRAGVVLTKQEVAKILGEM